MAHFEDCKFFLRGTCANGLYCGFRHNEASCRTERLCNRWVAGYMCDGRCNLRHPSSAEIAEIAALATAPPPAAPRAPPQQSVARPVAQRPRPLGTTTAGATSPASAAAAAAAAAATAAARAAAAAAATAAVPGAPPCRFYAQGRCTKGNTCPFSHHLTPAGSPSAAAAPASLRAAAAATRAAALVSARKAAAGAGAGASAAAAGERGRQGVGATGGVERGANGSAGRVTGLAGSRVDAVAKAKAAQILQKHRLTAGLQGVQRGARGTRDVSGSIKQPDSKRPKTETPAPRLPQPQHQQHQQQQEPSGAAGSSKTPAMPSKSRIARASLQKGGRNGGGTIGETGGEEVSAALGAAPPAASTLLASRPARAAERNCSLEEESASDLTGESAGSNAAGTVVTSHLLSAAPSTSRREEVEAAPAPAPGLAGESSAVPAAAEDVQEAPMGDGAVSLDPDQLERQMAGTIGGLS